MCAASLLRLYYRLLPAALLIISTYVAAQSPEPSATQPSPIRQPISRPSRDDILTAGSVFKIEWTPDPHFSNITLELWDKTTWGYSRDFGNLCFHWVNPFCGTVVDHAPNTGSYEWHIPKPGSNFPRGERVFWIKMYVDDYAQSDYNKDPVLSYSQNFAFAPEPGQNVTITETTTSGSAARTDGPQQGTVYVTVHDGISTSVITVEPTAVFNASVTAGFPQETTKLAAPSPNVAANWRMSIPIVFLAFVGFL